MARSKRLSLRDVRAVFWLMGECRELGADVAVWRRHLAAGLCRLTGALVGIVAELEYSQQAEAHPLHFEDVGWPCPADRRRALEQFLASDYYGRDLLAERFFRNPPVQLRTVHREQVISDSEWLRSATFNDFLRQGNLDLGIMSQQRFGGGTRTNTVILYPLFRKAPLPERSRRLVHLTQQELGPLLGTALAVAREPGWSNLPPRWRQTLDCLLDGDSEKQAALRLGISPLTIHQYIKGLYEHFGVSSRGELLAFFLRRYVAARPWSEPRHPPTWNDNAQPD